ncbi:MAG: hypothetical protein Q8M29_01800 [Bacteroidota bacterium]|nr:hypothetical protein [Bacteroidota bacterium]
MKTTKGTIFLLTLLACFMLSTSSSKSFTTKLTKQVPASGFITVCHGGRNLKVSPNSLELHLRHGDRLGGCLADTH